jgi:hypothetical protein
MYRHYMLATTANAGQPDSFRDLIGLWPSARAFARDAGCSPALVRQWRHRDSVPARYWRGIIEGAARRGLHSIDAAWLTRLAARRRTGSKERGNG